MSKILKIISTVYFLSIFSSGYSIAMDRVVFELEASPNEIKRLGGAPLTLDVTIDDGSTSYSCTLKNPNGSGNKTGYWLFDIPEVRNNHIQSIMLTSSSKSSRNPFLDFERALVNAGKGGWSKPKAEQLTNLLLEDQNLKIRGVDIRFNK